MVFVAVPESQSTPARLQPKKACIETKDEERAPKVETNGVVIEKEIETSHGNKEHAE